MRLFKNTNPNSGTLDEGYVTLAHKPPSAAEPMRIVLRGRNDTYGLYLAHEDLRIIVNAILHPDYYSGEMHLTTGERQRVKEMMAQWEGVTPPDDVAESPAHAPTPSPQETARQRITDAFSAALAAENRRQQQQQAEVAAAINNPITWPEGNPVITNPDGGQELVLTVPYAPPKTNPAIKLLEQNARAIDDLNENRERALIEYDQALAALKQEQAMALSTLVHDEILIHYLAGDDSADANR